MSVYLNWTTTQSILSSIPDVTTSSGLIDTAPVPGSGSDGNTLVSYTTQTNTSSLSNFYQAIVTLYPNATTKFYSLFSSVPPSSSPVSVTPMNLLISIPKDYSGTEAFTQQYPSSFNGVKCIADESSNNTWDALLCVSNNGFSGNGVNSQVPFTFPTFYFVLHFYQFQEVDGIYVPILVGKGNNGIDLPSANQSSIFYYDISSTAAPTTPFDFALVFGFQTSVPTPSSPTIVAINPTITLISQNGFNTVGNTNTPSTELLPQFAGHYVQNGQGATSIFYTSPTVKFPLDNTNPPTFIYNSSNYSYGVNNCVANSVGFYDYSVDTNYCWLCTNYNVNAYVSAYQSLGKGSINISTINLAHIYNEFTEIETILDYFGNTSIPIYDTIQGQNKLFNISVPSSSVVKNGSGLSFTITATSGDTRTFSALYAESTIPSGTFETSFGMDVLIPGLYTGVSNQDQLLFVANPTAIQTVDSYQLPIVPLNPIIINQGNTVFPATYFVMQFYKFVNIAGVETPQKVGIGIIGNGSSNNKITDGSGTIYTYDITSNDAPGLTTTSESWTYDFVMIFSYQTGATSPNVSFLSPSNFNLSVTSSPISIYPSEWDFSQYEFNVSNVDVSGYSGPQNKQVSYQNTTMYSTGNSTNSGVVTNLSPTNLPPAGQYIEQYPIIGIIFTPQSSQSGPFSATVAIPGTYNSYDTIINPTIVCSPNTGINFGSQLPTILTNVVYSVQSSGPNIVNCGVYNTASSSYYVYSSGYAINNSGYLPAFVFSSGPNSAIFVSNTSGVNCSYSQEGVPFTLPNQINYCCLITQYTLNQYLSLSLNLNFIGQFDPTFQIMSFNSFTPYAPLSYVGPSSSISPPPITTYPPQGSLNFNAINS